MFQLNLFALLAIVPVVIILLLTACEIQVEPPDIPEGLPGVELEPPDIPLPTFALDSPRESLPVAGLETPDVSVLRPSPPSAPPVGSEPGTNRETPGVASPDIPLTVAPIPAALPKYDRKEWRHWVDQDRDCQDARQEVLIAESEIPVTFKSSKGCKVAAGRWTGPYTGRVVTDPAKLDVDHVVPLANAHRSGGWAWDSSRKRAYANDLQYPGHLAATTAAANREKGADGPEDWRPPDTGYWCAYALDWIAIKSRWGLTATPREYDALGEMLETCDRPGVGLPPNRGQPAFAAYVPPAYPVAAPQYDPAGPDRDCGDFDTWEQAQTFYRAAGGPEQDPHRLDGDGNGSACESLR